VGLGADRFFLAFFCGVAEVEGSCEVIASAAQRAVAKIEDGFIFYLRHLQAGQTSTLIITECEVQKLRRVAFKVEGLVAETIILITIKRIKGKRSEKDFVFCKVDGKPCDPDWLGKKVLHPALEAAKIQRISHSQGIRLSAIRSEQSPTLPRAA